MVAYFTPEEAHQLYRAGWVIWRDPGHRDVAIYRLGNEILLFEPDEGFLSRVPREDRVDDLGVEVAGWESQAADDAWDPVATSGARDIVGDLLSDPMRGAINADQVAGDEILRRFVDRQSGIVWAPGTDVSDDRVQSLMDYVEELRHGHVERRKREMGINPRRPGLGRNAAVTGGRVEVTETDVGEVAIDWFPDIAGYSGLVDAGAPGVGGYIVLAREEADDLLPYPRYRVDYIEVDDELRRQGAATRLYQEALACARARGATLASDNRLEYEARAFWKKQRLLGNAERIFTEKGSFYVMKPSAGPILPN